jgi:hypothetical protein
MSYSKLENLLVHNNDQIVLIVLFKYEQTGLQICATRICDRSDRSSSFKLLIKRVAVAMVNKTVVAFPSSQQVVPPLRWPASLLLIT